MSREIFSKKSVIAGLLILAAFLAYNRYQQFQKRKSIETEKQSLQKQIDQVEQKNQEMENSLKYLSSLSSKEKTAREQLNLKRQGEKVYSFTQVEDRGTASEAQKNKGPKNNIYKWWLYFNQ